jgi:hypothetical protein
MFTTRVAGYTLQVSDTAIEYNGTTIDPRAATRIRWVRTNQYLNGVLFEQVRHVIVSDSDNTIKVDCDARIGSGEREAQFQSTWKAIWNTAGLSIAGRVLDELKYYGEVELCECKVERAGVWIEGSWKFLQWSGKPRLVQWQELRISNSEADLVIASLVDPSKATMKNFNETDNAPVLDFLVPTYPGRA